ARGGRVRTARKPMPTLAPHSADAAIAALPAAKFHQLTIDAVWQKSLQELARERARLIGSDISVAILAVDHASGEVLARVASAGYFGMGGGGQVDMRQVLRSPGPAAQPVHDGLGLRDGVQL